MGMTSMGQYYGGNSCGLGLDYDNQETLSEERIKSWTELIQSGLSNYV